jgi:hypothetical protein
MDQTVHLLMAIATSGRCARPIYRKPVPDLPYDDVHVIQLPFGTDPSTTLNAQLWLYNSKNPAVVKKFWRKYWLTIMQEFVQQEQSIGKDNKPNDILTNQQFVQSIIDGIESDLVLHPQLSKKITGNFDAEFWTLQAENDHSTSMLAQQRRRAEMEQSLAADADSADSLLGGVDDDIFDELANDTEWDAPGGLMDSDDESDSEDEEDDDNEGDEGEVDKDGGGSGQQVGAPLRGAVEGASVPPAPTGDDRTEAIRMRQLEALRNGDMVTVNQLQLELNSIMMDSVDAMTEETRDEVLQRAELFAHHYFAIWFDGEQQNLHGALDRDVMDLFTRMKCYMNKGNASRSWKEQALDVGPIFRELHRLVKDAQTHKRDLDCTSDMRRKIENALDHGFAQLNSLTPAGYSIPPQISKTMRLALVAAPRILWQAANGNNVQSSFRHASMLPKRMIPLLQNVVGFAELSIDEQVSIIKLLPYICLLGRLGGRISEETFERYCVKMDLSNKLRNLSKSLGSQRAQCLNEVVQRERRQLEEYAEQRAHSDAIEAREATKRVRAQKLIDDIKAQEKKIAEAELALASQHERVNKRIMMLETKNDARLLKEKYLAKSKSRGGAVGGGERKKDVGYCISHSGCCAPLDNGSEWIACDGSGVDGARCGANGYVCKWWFAASKKRVMPALGDSSKFMCLSCQTTSSCVNKLNKKREKLSEMRKKAELAHGGELPSPLNPQLNIN